MIRVCFISSDRFQFFDGLESDVVLQVDASESCWTQFFGRETLLEHLTALFESHTSLSLKSLFAGEEVIVFLIKFVEGKANFWRSRDSFDRLFAYVLHWVIFQVSGLSDASVGGVR